MIAEKDTDREVIGTLSGVTHKMGIADDAVAHVMDQLSSGLYSRPKEAVMREYSTNARDAHVEAGCPERPIEVKLPTAFNPVLSFRDYGVGLDESEIGSIYSQYGASTKRSSNEFNGMLGFGCKSAFAYGNRFTVVSIKNGVRIEVAVTREEDGTGGMIVVDQRSTDEHRGTLVQIPCKSGDNFQAEAQAIFQWWAPGSVKILGAQTFKIAHFDPSDESNLKLAEGLYVNQPDAVRERSTYRYGEKEDVIIMGGVAYPHRFSTDLPRYTHRLVVFAPMGAVNFQSSREALRMNSVTKKFLAETEEKYKKALIDTLQKHIDAAPSRAAAAKVVANWKAIVPAKLVPAGGYIYKGLAIPDTVKAAVDANGRCIDRLFAVPLRRHGYHNGHEKRAWLSLERMVDCLFVDGYTVEKFTSAHAQKLRKYADDNKLDIPNGFVLVGTIPADIKPWLEHVVSWETIKAIKLPRNQPAVTRYGVSRIPGSYDLFTTERGVLGHQLGVPADTFKSWKSPLFYTTGSVNEAGYIWKCLTAVQPSATLVCMRSDRVEKFRRNFPNAVRALDAVKSGFASWSAGLAKDELLALAIQAAGETRDLHYYDASKVDDPTLKLYIQLCGRDVTAVAAQVRNFRSVLGQALTLPKVEDMNRKYPLMETSYKNHTYIYVNAVYAAQQKGAI